MNLSTVLLFAAASAAQPVEWIPPEIVVESLTRVSHPKLPVDEVAIGDAAGLEALQYDLQRKAGVRQEDIALIRVIVRGQWFFTLEDSVKERAAALGANYLVFLQSFGNENLPGAYRIYRAVRLQRYDGLPAYTLPPQAVETPPRARASRSSLPEPARWKSSLRPPPRKREPLDWLWRDYGFVLSHRLVVDLSKLPARAWRELDRVVRAHFPREARAVLLQSHKNGARVVIDMRQRKLWLDS